MTSSSQFRGNGPPKCTTGEYQKAYDDVKSLGSKTSTTRTAEQSQIALFWGDGPATCTPPGHWCIIAHGVSLAKGWTLIENARAFALLALALADAAIAAWDMKFTYWSWRPITGIPKGSTDGNPHTTGDPIWQPLLTTPNFPDYVSGHSTFSEASAEVLKHLCGTDQVPFSTTSDALPGATRSFQTFSEAADEAGRSRIYGGIHFNFSNQDGQQAGRKLAQQACTRFLKKI
jgi:hypothetical protein